MGVCITFCSWQLLLLTHVLIPCEPALPACINTQGLAFHVGHSHEVLDSDLTLVGHCKAELTVAQHALIMRFEKDIIQTNIAGQFFGCNSLLIYLSCVLAGQLFPISQVYWCGCRYHDAVVRIFRSIEPQWLSQHISSSHLWDTIWNVNCSIPWRVASWFVL